jgi:anaerobic dimethyl sulfoxide reductase subunit A
MASSHDLHVQYRAEHYAFFALSFLSRPDRTAIGHFLHVLTGTQPDGAIAAPSALISALEKAELSAEDDWNALCSEYSALFEAADGRFLPLWESGLYEKAVLLNKSTLSVKRFYRQCGIKLNASSRQLEDHIGVECALMHLLITADKPVERVMKNGCSVSNAQVGFMKKHLSVFGTSFGGALKAWTVSSYWIALADYFALFIREDTDFLKSVCDGGAPLTALRTDCPALLEALFEHLPPGAGGEPAPVKLPVSGTNNCGGRCLLYATVQDGAVLRLDGGRQKPEVSPEAQFPCVRGGGYRQTYLNSARLRYPMRRVGMRGEGRFERLAWDEALDELARRIKDIKVRYGPASRYINYATGNAGVLRGDTLARHLLALDGGYLDFYNTYSSACAEIATPYVYGTDVTGSTSDTLTDAKLILLWGHNPVETVFGSATRGDLMRAKTKGARIVAVDPRYSASAQMYADRWIGLRPTTDGALIDAMAFVILSEGLQNQTFMDEYCLGFDAGHMPAGFDDAENYVDYCLGRTDGVPKTPRWAAAITGVPADVIAGLAREYALSKPAALLPGYGYQRHGNGEQAVRSLAMLACLTGNVGVRGGGAGGLGAVRQNRKPKDRIETNPLGLSIPSFLWTDAVARGAEMTFEDGIRGDDRLPSPIKMIFNLAGNTLLNQHSDIRATADILRNTALCEYIVCSDVFMTPSAKFADLLLPGTSLFETRNILKPWEQGNYLLYNDGLIPPLFEARFEYDWLSDLSERLGLKDAFTQGRATMSDRLRALYDETRETETELPPYDEFTRAGGYHYRNNKSFIAFENEIRDPANHPFPTPSGKIEIFSPRLFDIKKPDSIPAIPKYIPSFEGPADVNFARYPLQLIAWHMKTRCHSIHFSCSPTEAEDEQVLWMHPADAQKRSIGSGDTVAVWNDRGKVLIKAFVTDKIVPGVLAMPQGAWYRPDPDGIDAGGCINTLTTLRPTPLAKGNPQHSNLVEVGLAEPS